MNKKIQNRHYRRLLLDEISNKHECLKLLNEQLENETNILNDSRTWTKGICIRYSINTPIISYVKNIQQTHNKKFDSLCKKKQQDDGIKKNFNITNFVKWWIPSFTLWIKRRTCNILKRDRHPCKSKIDLGSNQQK